MPGNYVDNAMNRSLGRVGMPRGSCVHSRSSGSSSPGFSAAPSRTYVDNSMNRSLDRVGQPLGSAVHSRSGLSSFSSSSSSSSSPSNYTVHNPTIQKQGHVGLSVGSAVHATVFSAPRPTSSSSSSSTRTYVDNPMNRQLGRVGLPVGSAVHSKNASASSSTSGSARPAPPSTKTYVDNPMNRNYGRVGLPVGSAVQSKNPSASSSTSYSSRVDGKVYRDNDFNRRHNRVGLPLGSKPIKKGNAVYADNAINRHLNRVGSPMGTQAVSKSHLAHLRKWLLNKDCFAKEQSVSGDSGFAESASQLFPEFDLEEATGQSNDHLEHVMEGFNREREEDLWMDLTGKSIRSSIKETDCSSSLTLIQSKPIQLDDLDLRTKIGHGGFGEVYLAEYEGQVLAVKILTQTNFTKKRMQLFEKEIMTHSKLDHPNIVKFYGPCLEMPRLAIVMEYMDGSLWESLHRNEVEFPDKLHIIRDMTLGLDYLHSIPLVHGDLKTQNVLLINIPGTPAFDDSQPTIAKLSDFGLSLLKSDSETSQSTLTTQKHQPIGATLRYAAPEVIRGDMLSTREMLKTDIYSMGLIIMELAVEEIAFERLNFVQLLKQVGEKGTKPATPPGLILDKNLEKMLHQCWNFEPLDRPDALQLKKMASRLSGILEE